MKTYSLDEVSKFHEDMCNINMKNFEPFSIQIIHPVDKYTIYAKVFENYDQFWPFVEGLDLMLDMADYQMENK